MNTWYSGWLKEKLWDILKCILVLALVASTVAYYVRPTPTPDTLKDFKDGIQNHLVWSIKGECFFVRPHAETTVYLIRVADCDRK
jgi:hypothetical protein